MNSNTRVFYYKTWYSIVQVIMAYHTVLICTVLSLMLLSVSGSNGVEFSGFVEDGTYYTNGGTVTELTCNASYNKMIITNRTWFYEISDGSDEDTRSSVVRFEDVVNGSGWGNASRYYCRAVYEDNAMMSANSGNITVIAQCKLHY